MGDELTSDTLPSRQPAPFHLFAGDDRDDIYQGMHAYQGPHTTLEDAQRAVECKAGGVFAWNWAHIAIIKGGRLKWLWRGYRRGNRAMEWTEVKL